MLTANEHKAIKIFNLSDLKERSILTTQAKAETPSPEFLAYILRQFERVPKTTEKLANKERRTIALLIELLDFPKLELVYPESIFNRIAPFFNKSPSTIRRYYYDYQKEAEYFASVVKQYQDDPESIPQTLAPVLQIYIEDTKLYTDYFNSHP